jgi:hypothetical protein
MPTKKQIEANRRNAKHSTGPITQEGKDKSRFNALVHGLRAESAVIPGEDQSKFDLLLAGLKTAWDPQDDMEKQLVEQIALSQWKLARIDRNEGRLYLPEVGAAEYALAVHRIYLTQVRLERAISQTILDLERYRESRLDRQAEAKAKSRIEISPGIYITDPVTGESYYDPPPHVKGIDGKWREIPREIMGDFAPFPPLSVTDPNYKRPDKAA